MILQAGDKNDTSNPSLASPAVEPFKPVLVSEATPAVTVGSDPPLASEFIHSWGERETMARDLDFDVALGVFLGKYQ